MKAHLKNNKEKVRESLYGMMGENSKVHSVKIKCMGKVNCMIEKEILVEHIPSKMVNY